MANPAPTINQINAFNATQGTTIDFNIIGGTELVRSNKIYIYDLSDNSLICTHLYVSTESIHELPANTDSSIVYESGKSSADFVNGAQYYAQIQTFTDTAGTQGGSGLSVAKMFWCLVDPTLTITTIPSTISTTSYNVSATYTDTSASVVSNIIQQYQFSLYSATGSLLQSSGVVVGSGTQQGTSTAYDISYNFIGLSVGSSYYVVVDVTTTQGMSVTTQSNTFTVSIDTPTLGEATVVNNACDGYISVTSNLSSEYGGSASGEIASFVTNSVNNISSLKVTLDPIQDLHGYDKPWVGGAGKNKIDISQFTTGRTAFGLTSAVSGEYVRFTGTCSSGGSHAWAFVEIPSSLDALASTLSYKAFVISGTAPTINSITYNSGSPSALAINVSGLVTNQSYDFTIGIVGYSDGTEPTTWTPWENICPISGHDEVGVSVNGVNQFNKSTVDEGYIRDADGTVNGSVPYMHTDYIPVTPNATYYVKTDQTNGSWGAWYDSNKAYISSAVGWINNTLTAPSNAYYLRLTCVSNTSGNIDTFAVNYPSTDHDYHTYNGQTYTTTLPSTTYGGTLDLVSGVLTVTHATKSGKIEAIAADSYSNIVYGRVGKGSNNASYGNFYYHGEISNEYEITLKPTTWDSTEGIGHMYYGGQSGNYWIGFPIGTTLAQMQTATENVVICYELATPTTYQLTPQQIQTLLGQNNVWSEQQGEIELSYHIPITNLLVKRQDVDDVSGNWLTLYSQPITQASDMDFTFIDFLNQYGKTYKYALVPLLTQQQSGVEVEVEGGYTVSDEVQSVFDGVFIADSTGSQKCKANVGYGNVDMNQVVGSITPIGAKYPIVITNSQNQYHNGSISGTIVPDDYYFNGNLSRIDMVNKRSELEQFLTNKRAKIIKDWNGNIWLVMIMDNVSCTFNNNYGMGIVNFSTSWVEVGDPTNQQDLQATGLINIGGV